MRMGGLDAVATCCKLIRSSGEDDFQEGPRKDRWGGPLQPLPPLCSFLYLILRFWNRTLTRWSLSFSPVEQPGRGRGGPPPPAPAAPLDAWWRWWGVWGGGRKRRLPFVSLL